MKLFSIAVTFTVLSITANAFAGPLADRALKFVPGGKVLQEKSKEVKVQTPKGSIVEVEFKRDGVFEEASGDDSGRDIFLPENDLISLSDAVTFMKKAGKTPTGEWSLEESFVHDWHYEFEGLEDGKKMEYKVDAKTGKIVDSKVD